MGNKVVKGVNDLATTHPLIAKEWHPTKNGNLNPTEVLAGSNKKVWWVCPKGHEYKSMIFDRAKDNCGCPICSNKIILPGYNDLKTWAKNNNRLDLINEWDYEKNKPLVPKNFSYGSGKKVWWKCKNGHSYFSTIVGRVSGKGCKYCAHQKALKGKTDFATTHPLLAKEWHPTKNGNLKPTDFLAGSNKKVWWKCKNGHEWETKICDRALDHSNCPYCSNRRLLKGFNDLGTKFPEIAKSWHPTKNKGITPSDIVYSTHKKYWWICKHGHSWQCQVYSRTMQKYGCPLCARARIYKGVNDIFTTNPELKNEWDFEKNKISPYKISVNYKGLIWWKLPNGFSYQQTPHHKKRYKIEDKIKKNLHTHILVKGYNDLLTKFPKISKEWHPTKNGKLLPSDFTCGSGRKVWWICPDGHEYQAVIRDRVTDHTNCPICSLRKQSSFPEQALYYYFKKIYPDAINKYKSMSLFGNHTMELDIFIPSISLGIEYDGYFWHNSDLAYKREIKKYEICHNDSIKLIRIRQDNKKDLLDFSRISAADNTYYLSKNYKEEELERLIQDLLDEYDYFHQVFSKDFGFCSSTRVNLKKDKIKILEYLNNLSESFASRYPDVAKTWHPSRNGKLKPSMFNVTSPHKAWWICPKCGKEFEQTIRGRSKSNTKYCLECAAAIRGKNFSKMVIRERGSLAVNNPMLAKEWHPTKNGDLTPYDITTNSPRRVWWICSKCGYEWFAPPNHRSKGIGCPHCSGRVAMPGVDDLKTLKPEILVDWDYSKNKVDPSTLKPGSGYRAWWKCHKCGFEWQSSVKTKNSGYGCRKCSQYKPVLQYDLNGKLIKEWENISAAAKLYGNSTNISRACKRKSHLYKNYIWKFKNKY